MEGGVADVAGVGFKNANGEADAFDLLAAGPEALKLLSPAEESTILLSFSAWDALSAPV